MKKTILIFVLAILTFWAGIATARDYPDEYLGLPGDNLNLYATMKLFQESETLEGFERSLNDPNSHINNLDLNGDNLVDYISVVDYVDGDVHNIVLRTQLNRNEAQDIAVFTVQRFDDGTARIQLIGDEALYGKNYIVEPIYADSQETPNPGYMGSSVVVTSQTPVVVTTYEVAAWPIIRLIYRPGYVRWHSIWGWGHYPSYWNPWHTYYWHTYYGYQSHFNHYYYAHYRHWNHYRYPRYHDFYYSHVRAHSPKVSVGIRRGNYRTTYSRPDLRRRGDEIYRRTAGRTNSSRQAVRNRTNNTPNSYSGRRTVSGTPSRTRTNSSVNRGAVDTRRSSTIQSGRSTANPSRGSENAVYQGRSSSRSSYGTGTRSSVSTRRQAPQKTTINNSRSSGSSTVGRSYRQPTQSPATYSSRSSSKPRVSSTSSGSRSSYRQPNVSSRSGNSSRQPKVSSQSHSTSRRSSGVTSRSSRNSNSRSSSVKSSRSSSSRSSKANSKSSRSRSSSDRKSVRR